MGILDDALEIQDGKRSQRLSQAARKAKIDSHKIKEGTYRGMDLVDGTARIQLDGQPNATSGYRLITNAPLGDGDRVSIRPNGVGLPRADARNVAPLVEEIPEIMDLLYRFSAAFIVGFQRPIIEEGSVTFNYSLTDILVSGTGKLSFAKVNRNGKLANVKIGTKRGQKSNIDGLGLTVEDDSIGDARWSNAEFKLDIKSSAAPFPVNFLFIFIALSRPETNKILAFDNLADGTFTNNPVECPIEYTMLFNGASQEDYTETLIIEGGNISFRITGNQTSIPSTVTLSIQGVK